METKKKSNFIDGNCYCPISNYDGKNNECRTCHGILTEEQKKDIKIKRK
jgi:hypothetical protein